MLAVDLDMVTQIYFKEVCAAIDSGLRRLLVIRTSCDESRTNLAKVYAHSMRVSIDKSTVHRVVDCMQSYRDRGAPLLELSSYSFSKYMNFETDVDLAMSPLQTNKTRK